MEPPFFLFCLGDSMGTGYCASVMPRPAFETYIESVKENIAQATGLLLELRQYVPLRILKLVYLALFDIHRPIWLPNLGPNLQQSY